MIEAEAPINQTWSIYHSDREYSKALGDPHRTVAEALRKIVAEETAA